MFYQPPLNLIIVWICGEKVPECLLGVVRVQIRPRQLTGWLTEQLVERHSLKQSITEFLSSSSAAHLEWIPVLDQQLCWEVNPRNLLRHRLRHQLSNCLCPAGPWLTHHQSKMTSHSRPHHVQNSAKEVSSSTFICFTHLNIMLMPTMLFFIHCWWLLVLNSQMLFSYLGGMLDSGEEFLGSKRANNMASTVLMWAMTGNRAVFWTEMEDFSTM